MVSTHLCAVLNARISPQALNQIQQNQTQLGSSTTASHLPLHNPPIPKQRTLQQKGSHGKSWPKRREPASSPRSPQNGDWDLELASKQRDLTGPFFIQKYPDTDTISIVTKDSVLLVQAIRNGKLTSLKVTTAFCKTAAVAHQIVRLASRHHVHSAMGR